MTNPILTSISFESLERTQRRKGHGRVTLKDVATHAGVTTMTVSRFLRSPDQVAPSTAQKITESLSHTGYSPNLQAGSLASGRSPIVAVIVPNMSHSIFADTLHGLGQGLQTAGLQMLVASSNYSFDQEKQQIRAVLGWAPAALVLTGRHHHPGACDLIQHAIASGMPVIEMWDWNPQAMHGIGQVGFDHHEAGALMAQTLLARGYRDAVFMDSGVKEDFRAHERGQGFAQAMQTAGRNARVITAPTGDPVQAGRSAFEQWLSEQSAPVDCGMAFANDMMAMGAWLAADAQKLACPENLGLLGFGDFPIARHWGGGLSTLQIDGGRLGRECAQMLHRLRMETARQSPASWHQHIAPQLLLRAT